MLDYSLSPETRKILSQDIRRVQTAIGMRANAEFGIAGSNGICKWEGGVIVNGHEIAIMPTYVVDDFGDRHSRAATMEEQAVVDAIESVVAGIEAFGLGYVKDFEPCTFGDPLRCLMGM